MAHEEDGGGLKSGSSFKGPKEPSDVDRSSKELHELIWSWRRSRAELKRSELRWDEKSDAIRETFSKQLDAVCRWSRERRGLSELGLGRELFADEEGGRNWTARRSYSDEEGVSGGGREKTRKKGKKEKKKQIFKENFVKHNLIFLKVRVFGTK